MRYSSKRKTTRRRRGGSTFQSPDIVGKIYADWCGHCKDLAPEWETMKTNLITQMSGNVPEFIEIESKDWEAKRNHLEQKTGKIEFIGYPTIFKWKKGGKVEYYNGNRTANELTQWIMKQNGGKRKRKTYKRRG
jgi:thiol-disulfide isomerase/thioredoxin